MIRLVIVLAVGVALLAGVRPLTAVARDGDGDVRVTGVCGKGTKAKLRVRSRDDGLEVRFEVDYTRARVPWRVVLVHERRVAWKGTVKTTSPYGSFEIRRTLSDFPGADAVTARAWGPSGVMCRATAVLPG